MGHFGEASLLGVPRRPRVHAEALGAESEIGTAARNGPATMCRTTVVTTSGNYLPAAFNCSRDGLGMDRITLGTDFPYEDMDACMDFLRSLPMSEDERTMLYETNARALGF